MQSPLKALMVQGTTSDAGKSVFVAALCRVLARKGVKVSPFKPQNMALNSAVTLDGGEIGRAQAVQARASCTPSSVHMNPVLLKPNSDTGAQVILQGKAIGDMEAVGYDKYKQTVFPKVLESFSILQDQYQTVVIEGAGSPAEINLRHNDIANMGFAEAADVPVVIIADIDRGGVFAHIVGTLELLSKSEQERVIGFVINRFRGDISLLQSGLDWLEERTAKPVLGVLPFLHGLELEAEDSVNNQQLISQSARIRVIVPILTRMSNHTDFDVLRAHPDIDFQYVGKGERIEHADLVILPGTKSVRADLEYLRSQHWDNDIQRHIRLGGKLIGICGGYQMLGRLIHDPHGVEGEAGTSQGLGYLSVETELTTQKHLSEVKAILKLDQKSAVVSGYEIHVGQTSNQEDQSVIFSATHLDAKDGAISDCNQIFGTYLHGIFDTPDAFALICEWLGIVNMTSIDHAQQQETAINRIADAVEEHIDLTRIWPELY
ncbi:cobyric acid synthase [Vibrio zhanjiangensis]|uniref:Cobyric acid synthase n=1 Tax=Vibrio zhanjiangensis TaxID=1046128 RepID=A0ABQ6F177_9VIBR|nr:cobyric acid synthase [Vibrio zhanjiangensis]GLT18631.1 cobyric acid synthase [Vibrio zhanjiangensis]